MTLFNGRFHSRTSQMCDAEHSGETATQERSEQIALQQENLKLKQELEWLKLNDEGREGISSVLRSEAMGDLSPTRPTALLHAHSASDKAYFQSYSLESIHREMLSDKAFFLHTKALLDVSSLQVRTEGYRRAIEDNCHLFRGKTIMDVGCGTGILSLMACRAGAKRVYAVDASLWPASVAERVVSENGFRDRVHVFHSKVEDIDVDLEDVDIIVSEWMGYALLFESMLSSVRHIAHFHNPTYDNFKVLYARDRWLRPDGLVFPDKARLLMAGASEGALDIAFWKVRKPFVELRRCCDSMTGCSWLLYDVHCSRYHSTSPIGAKDPLCCSRRDSHRSLLHPCEQTPSQ